MDLCQTLDRIDARKTEIAALRPIDAEQEARGLKSVLRLREQLASYDA